MGTLGRLVALASLVVLVLWIQPATATTYTVLNTNDSGAGSLRQAILDANGSVGADTITFALPGPSFTIAPATALPSLSDAVTIDGTSQPGYAGTPIVELDGGGTIGDGLVTTGASAKTIRGLLVNRFVRGLHLQGTGVVSVEGNYIGIDAAGIAAQGNLNTGVIVNTGSNAVIGGSGAGDGNVISGNGATGISIQGGANNTVQGNRIGTNAAGTAAVPNGTGLQILGGAVIGSSGNTIGGSGAGEGNLISGNSSNGILLNTNAVSPGITGTTIQGNLIGTNAAGSAGIPNGASGITIGGVGGVNGATIGGIEDGQANTIAFNAFNGVEIANLNTEISIRGNSIHDNDLLGIDLLPPGGVTGNDGGDADDGGNDLQNFPDINSATSTSVSGSIDTEANTTYDIDVYASAACDGSTHGEGATLVDSFQLTTGILGTAGFTDEPLSIAASGVLAATATDPAGNTSEFSACFDLGGGGSGGTLDGSFSTPPASADLSAVGDEDWAVWGYEGSGPWSPPTIAPDVRKSGGSAISSLADINGFDPGDVELDSLFGLGLVSPTTFEWTNGSGPPFDNEAAAGLLHDGTSGGETNPVGTGFSFTVPADTTERTLRIYVSARAAVGQLTATLSDGSATAYVDTSLAGTLSESAPGLYTIDYAAASAGQTLAVEWIEQSTNDSPLNYEDHVAIHAVAIDGPGGGGGGGQPGPTFTVNSVADDDDGECSDLPDDCTLREAMNAANTTEGADDIVFDLDDTNDIELGSLLPEIEDPVTIDGSNLGDADEISIDGAGVGSGGDALVLGDGSGGSTITHLGIDGMSAIGGTGILVSSSGNTIQDVEIDDVGYGIEVVSGAANNLIGGSFSAGEGNQIFDFEATGISLDGAGTGNKVQGNTIGVDEELTANGGQFGIVVDGTNNTTIGAVAGPGDFYTPGLDQFGNVISGADNLPGGDGLEIVGGSSGTVVAFNRIGTDRDGNDENLDNLGAGIRVIVSSGNQLGPGNIIAHNGSSDTGIHIESGSGNRIVANSIHDNLGLGIDLDEGANGDIPAPTLTSAFVADGGTATVTGSLGGATGSYFIEFFKNTSCDGLAGGEGETYVGFATVTITEIGSSFVGSTFAGVAEGDVLTATTTRGALPEDTSEFSNCVDVEIGGGLDPPVLFGAVPNADGNTLGVSGAWDSGVEGPNLDYFDVRFYSVPECDDSAPKTLLGLGGTLDTNEGGIGAFAIDGLTNVPVGTLVTATVNTEGDTSGISNCVVADRNNTSWPTALGLDPSDTDNGYLRSLGQSRWFKVPVVPNSRVSVTVSDLPADYDVVVFKDIEAKYEELVGGAAPDADGPNLALDDLNRAGADTPVDLFNTSQYNPSSWDPTNWDPTLNQDVFSPQYSPTEFSPTEFSAGFTAPTEFSPTEFSPTEFSPTEFSPTEFSPTEFSPNQFSADAWATFSPADPRAFSAAQTASLVAVSATAGTGNETVSVNTWNNTGFFYVRVQGKNGSFVPGSPFSIQVSRGGNPCAGVDVVPSTPPAPVAGVTTLILTDSSRWEGASLAAMNTALSQLAGRPEVDGQIVDLAPLAAAQNAEADQSPGCPYAKNLVAARIKEIVDAYRPDLRYVVVAGGDDEIPFFRYPDPALLGNETLYVPPVRDTSASQASLRLGYVLSDDFLASKKTVSLHGNEFPVPDIAIGRLVETPAEIAGMVNAYIGAGGVTTPGSSLVTGYDFLADAADDIAGTLAAKVPGSNDETLITNMGVSPGLVTVGNTPDRAHSWTAADLRRELLDQRHDITFLAGHFSANDALSADYRTNILTTELASSTVNLQNAIVFSAGCHAGYNIVNGDSVPNVTQQLDWAQAFAQKRTTLIAGTGYQYGDTDFLAHSERMYSHFAKQLGGPVGSSLLRSKQLFLEESPGLSALDEKALLQTTLFGLPMLSVNLPTPTLPSPAGVSPSPVGDGPGADLGLEVVGSFSVASALTPRQKTLNGLTQGPATWLEGPGGAVAVKPMQPVLPLVSRDVSAAGRSLRGVLFLGGSYQDTNDTLPLTAAPATELRGIHAPFSTDVFFPPQPWTINYFGTLAGSGATRLHVTPVQHRSQSPEMTRRTFSNMNFRLFYSSNTASYCGNRASQAPCLGGILPITPALSSPPLITGVDTSVTSGIRSIEAHVVGEPITGIQQVVATYTVDGSGLWQSIVLEQDEDDETLWTGALPAATPATFSFMIQAVNGVGRVTIDDNLGSYYRPGLIPGPPDPDADPPAATALTFTDAPPATIQFGQEFDVALKLTAGTGCTVGGKSIRVDFGGIGLPAVTNGSGDTPAVKLPAALLPATYLVTASFAGTPNCAAAEKSVSVQVMRRSTALDIAFPAVTLRTSTAPITPLPERTVIVTLKQGAVTRLTYVGRTDPQGRAQIPQSLLAPLPAGAYTVVAEYAGEAGYEAAAASGSGTTLNVIRRGAGNDVINGTAGNDLIIDDGGNNTINGNGGHDTIVVGGTGNNAINGGAGDDQITTGSGNDSIQGGDGDDVIDAGNGNNAVNAGDGNDRVKTGSGNDSIQGGAGDDAIDAGNGNNSVNAGAGSDTIRAGSGNDSIDGGPGFDYCNAGGGANSVRNCEATLP